MSDEIFMFNALWLKGQEGRRLYGEYSEQALDLVGRLGGRLDYALVADSAVQDDFVPDVLAVVRYPSREVFDDMVRSDEYQSFGDLRTRAAQRAILTQCRRVHP